MIALTIFFPFMVYTILAILFVFIVNKLTKRKFLVWLASASVILLPIWDVVLGNIVYYIGCRYIPKVAIYETAETDGIYYEGLHDYFFKLDRRGRQITDEELVCIGSIDNVFRNGYTFAESLVTKESISDVKDRKIKITPVIYRCIPLPKDESRPAFQRTSCSIVNEIKSRYMVTVTTTKLGIAEINFKKIYDRTTGKLMGEYKRVTLWSCFPFFEWLGWRWWSKGEGSLHCPSTARRYYSFEYEVLIPKK